MDFLSALEQRPAKEVLPLLQQRYQNNVRFFEKEIPALGVLLNQKTDHYHLYLDSRGINIATSDGKLLYPNSGEKSALIDISKKLSQNLFSNPFCNKHFNQKGVVKYNEPLVPFTTKLTNTIIEKAEQEQSFDNGSIYFGKNPSLPVTSIFGIMAGLQLEYLQQNYDYIHALLIYEPDPDFFLISSYFVDYEKLYQKLNERLFLVVKGELDPHIVKRFYEERMVTANYVRFEIATYEHPMIEQAKKTFLEIQRQNVRGWGTLDDELIGLNNHRYNIDPAAPKFPILAQSTTCGLPICVVGSGPSLQELLPFIKTNADKMIIFSAGTALKPLKEFGIEPDFQIETERRDHVKAVLEEAPLGETPLIGADVVDPSTLACAKEAYLFIRSDSCTSKMNGPKKQVHFTVPVVGNAAFALALELSNKVLMCGLDAGFREDGQQHIKGSLYDKLDDQAKEKIPVRGNLRKEVFTNPLLALSRHTYEKTIAAYPGKTVLNLSDGAFIKGAQPTPVNTLSLSGEDKQHALNEIKKVFTKKDLFSQPHKDYAVELEKYVENFFTLLDQPVTSRESMLRTVDAAYHLTIIQTANEPVTGTLIGGTFRHILHALYTSLLHLHKDDIEHFYSKTVKETKAALLADLKLIDPFKRASS